MAAQTPPPSGSRKFALSSPYQPAAPTTTTWSSTHSTNKRTNSPPPAPHASEKETPPLRHDPAFRNSDWLPSNTSPDAAQHLKAEEGMSLLSQARKSVDITPNFPLSKSQKPSGRLSAAYIIPIWITLSSAVILYNKYLYTNMDYPYALGTRVLRRTTNLLDGLDNIKMTRDLWFRTILPIGVLFSGSLILSNTAYLTLSVSFIQMLKAFTPVAILLISAMFKLQKLNRNLVGIVLLISTGCALAAYGEVNFELFGFICQCSAVLFEASRLVMIQVLLQGLKMDPLVSLHYYAPVCSIINACFLPFTEGTAPFRELLRIGPLVMISNAAVAFALNVSAVYLISAAGGLVLTLAGVFKDILLISSSVLFFGSTITSIQVFGYFLALGGLMAYKNSTR